MIRSLDFFAQLKELTLVAREKLAALEASPEEGTQNLSSVRELMFAIRGTAQQASFPQIAYLSGLGEDVAYLAESKPSGSRLRKCIGSMWDVLTTLDYMIERTTDEVGQERGILVNRLENTLKSLGGARPKVIQAEIDVLFRAKDLKSD
jgi:hypothetical protein